MSTITSPLPDEARKVVAEALQGALVDLIDLSLIAKQAHWNLIGHNFRSIHLQLDEIVSLAREHMDVMAERAVALGINPDGRVGTVAKSTPVQQLEAGYLQDGKVIAAMTDILDAMIKRMRERVRATEEPDPVTQDLLISVTQGLEKQHWMVQAQR
ncbi:starvation-inducible DNA-binding protein [Thermocatellispora tengchongensis]|uniref:Starvation-inducible DNA-binding protein n=1 Tax=Thermocatellispora tengchongensis TaxID=1073253 RepID=A0A840PEA4_9ACTN|nr:DNA starvation/stationary phase protection protein [Thermocatellispora tengchongensis]MBB5139754.1 starvation-inducible DNA-binding protein [Thermocatellispora tengchongensis]